MRTRKRALAIWQLRGRGRTPRCGRCVLLALLGLSPLAARGENAPLVEKATLYERAFGPAGGRTGRLAQVRLSVDGGTPTWVPALLAPLTPTGDVRVEARPVLEALQPRVRAQVQERLRGAVDAAGQLALARLEAAGLNIDFSHDTLSLRVEIPPGLRETSVRTVAVTGDEPETGVTASAASGFLNARLDQELRWDSRTDGAHPEGPLRLELESAVAVHGWVLEGSAGGVADGPAEWSRGDVRLVRDDPSSAIRYVLGDLRTAGTELEPGRQLLGTGAIRHFGLTPSRRTLPEESMELFLERPSRVDVLVNGRRVQTLHLGPGSHDLRGIVLDSGANLIELVATDDFGERRRVTKRVGLDGRQLSPGTHEFTYAAGFPARLGGLAQEHEWGRPGVQLAHRYGMSRSVTSGALVDADEVTQVLGLEQILATWLGTFGGAAQVSHRDGTLGWAGSARYELRRGGGRVGGSVLALAADYRSAGLASPSEPPRLEPRLTFSSRYGRYLARGLDVAVTGRLEHPGDGAERWGAGLTVSKLFDPGPGITFHLAQEGRVGEAGELRARVDLVWAWGGARRVVHATTDAAGTGSSSQLSVAQQGHLGNTALHASAGVAESPDGRRVSTSARARGPRAEVELTQSSAGAGTAHTGTVTEVQARVGTALVFAGGVLGWSRPVTGSFALVVRNESLDGHPVGVNRGADGYAAVADRLGPAVVSDLQPHAPATLRLGVSDLAPGTSLGPAVHIVRPGYRTGTVVRVGEAGSTYARSVLLGPDGEPVVLRAGHVVRLRTGAPLEPIAFFTNRAGRFVLTSLTPGDYLLRVEGSRAASQFTVPARHRGILDLDAVVLGRVARERDAGDGPSRGRPGAAKAHAPRG